MRSIPIRLAVSAGCLVGGGAGFCLSKVILRQATRVLFFSKGQSGWKQTAYKIGGCALLVLGSMTIVASAMSFGWALGVLLPPKVAQISVVGMNLGIIFDRHFGDKHFDKQARKILEWTHFRHAIEMVSWAFRRT